MFIYECIINKTRHKAKLQIFCKQIIPENFQVFELNIRMKCPVQIYLI